jgi:hypothetical protein
MPNRQLLPTVFFFAFSLLGQPAIRGSDSTEPSSVTKSGCGEKCSRSGQWFVVETENFQACSVESQATAMLLAKTAETLRCDLQTKWLGDYSQNAWAPKCQIVLHPNINSYLSACGRGSEHTVGSSLFKTEEGRIAGRRIDLLGGRADYLSAALPHELTHVVLKDRFPSSTMPRWADEGAAILADTDTKQGRHLHDLETALTQHTTFDAVRLLTMEDYPRPDQIGAFYGQSASVSEFLVNKNTPAMFVDFVQLASSKGYDAALRKCYGISDVHELDRMWRAYVDLSLHTSAPLPSGNILVAR